MGRGDIDYPSWGPVTRSQGPSMPHEISEVPLSAIISNRQEASLLGMARAIWRHRIVIAAVAALFMVLTGFYVAEQKPKYTSEGAIVIASREIMIPRIEAVDTPPGDLAGCSRE